MMVMERPNVLDHVCGTHMYVDRATAALQLMSSHIDAYMCPTMGVEADDGGLHMFVNDLNHDIGSECMALSSRQMAATLLAADDACAAGRPSTCMCACSIIALCLSTCLCSARADVVRTHSATCMIVRTTHARVRTHDRSM